MFQNIVKFLTPRKIGALYYEVKVTSYKTKKLSKINLDIQKQEYWRKTVYEALTNNKVVHRSTLVNFVPFLIQSGVGATPAIGDCVSMPEYRQLRIYPYVLGYILEDIQIQNSISKVGILVGPNNQASIPGIEQAGFKYVLRIQGTRIGPVFIRKERNAEDDKHDVSRD